MAALLCLGGGMGLVLYHAAFGFTGSWRAFLTERRGAGIRAQMLMLALATVVFLPALDAGTLAGRSIVGAVAPVGVAVVGGAFIFGIGMQLGGGCASGTLFTAGGGSSRMVVTLVFFIVGSTVATSHVDWWYDLPSAGGIALADTLGLSGALALQLGLFAAIAGGTWMWERQTRPDRSEVTALKGWRRFLQGPWPLVWGAVGLAAGNIATLALAGHPWSITFGFGLWGAKAWQAIGGDVSGWAFWTWSYPSRALGRSILADTVSVMNIGIVLGALLAAGLAGKFKPTFRIGAGPLAAAVIGGLLLGYGARLAFGCNIGALFSGIASGSVHGWVWLAAAVAGNWAGLRLRPVFRL